MKISYLPPAMLKFQKCPNNFHSLYLLLLKGGALTEICDPNLEETHLTLPVRWGWFSLLRAQPFESLRSDDTSQRSPSSHVCTSIFGSQSPVLCIIGLSCPARIVTWNDKQFSVPLSFLFRLWLFFCLLAKAEWRLCHHLWELSVAQ